MSHSYAILGAGKSGSAVIRYLSTRGERDITVYVPPEEVAATRAAYPAYPVTDDWSHIGQEILVRSPGIRPDRPAILAALSGGARLTQEVELFCEACPAPIFAVTGSDGKTTTATLAARLLEQMGKTVWLGGNIGRPLLGELERIRPTDRVVLELSSFQLMTFAPRLSAAAVTNLSENHLNWHRDMEEYRLAKCNLLLHAARRVQNLSSPVAPELASLTFSSTSATADYAEIAGMLTHAGTPLCLGSALQVPGRYNRENLLCAAALTDATPDAVRTVAEQFRGVEHRMEYVGCYGGVACYNSSIDTTPTRTAATLSALEHPCTVICGGSDKGLTVAPLTEALLAHAARVVFTGACGERMRDALLAAPAYAGTPGTCYLRDFEEAVHAALNMTPPSGTLVLSPAAASFDTFRSFEERGEAFRRLVREGRTKQPPTPTADT